MIRLVPGSIPFRVFRRTILSTALVVVVFGTSGCTSFGGSNPQGLAASENTAASGDEGRLVAPMTQTAMELLFAEEVDAILGPSGAIQTKVDGINVYLISDPVHDRMRIIAPIALLNKLDPRFLEVMLEANFSRTLDARYSTSEGVVYATFMHPLSSLTPELLKSSLAQVLNLAKTFGTRFSSGVLEWGDPGEGGPPAEGSQPAEDSQPAEGSPSAQGASIETQR